MHICSRSLSFVRQYWNYALTRWKVARLRLSNLLADDIFLQMGLGENVMQKVCSPSLLQFLEKLNLSVFKGVNLQGASSANPLLLENNEGHSHGVLHGATKRKHSSGKKDSLSIKAWHYDFVHEHVFNPHRFSAFIHPASYPGGYDIKVPWELSRGHQLVRLGQLYRISGNKEHALQAVLLMKDWIHHNPYGFGVNWVSTMDVAIRAVNWLVAYDLIHDSRLIDEQFYREFLKMMQFHGWHIRHHLEGGPHNPASNNHYIANLIGLIWLGMKLPGLRYSKSWLDFALPELWREVLRQTGTDGVDFEASIPYHRFVTEMVLLTIWLCRNHELNVPQRVMDRVEKMLSFLHAARRPDGYLPLLGDHDDGCLLRLAAYQEPQRACRDPEGLLHIGSFLFDRPEWRSRSEEGRLDACWLGLDPMDEPLAHQAGVQSGASYPEAGFYIMRGDDHFILIDAGSNGRNGIGGHGHNDLFSFELFASGQEWIIDPGCGSYTGNYEVRNRLRSSRSHNLVVVDGEELHPFDETNLWRLPDAGSVTLHSWEHGASMAHFEAEHDCYHRLKDPVTSRRSIRCDFSPFTLFVEDSFESKGPHSYTSYLHIPEGLECSLDSPRRLRLQASTGLEMRIDFDVESEIEAASLRLEEGILSPAYGVWLDVPVIAFHWKATGCTFLKTSFSITNFKGSN